MVKIRAEINEIETKEIVLKIDKTKSWFLKKIYKIDKPLAMLMKRNRIKFKLPNS